MNKNNRKLIKNKEDLFWLVSSITDEYLQKNLKEITQEYIKNFVDIKDFLGDKNEF